MADPAGSLGEFAEPLFCSERAVRAAFRAPQAPAGLQ